MILIPKDPAKLVLELESENEDLVAHHFKRNKNFWETHQSKEELRAHMEGRTWAELDAAIFYAKALTTSARELTLRGDRTAFPTPLKPLSLTPLQ